MSSMPLFSTFDWLVGPKGVSTLIIMRIYLHGSSAFNDLPVGLILTIPLIIYCLLAFMSFWSWGILVQR
jgi:hypothetical protein